MHSSLREHIYICFMHTVQKHHIEPYYGKDQLEHQTVNPCKNLRVLKGRISGANGRVSGVGIPQRPVCRRLKARIQRHSHLQISPFLILRAIINADQCWWRWHMLAISVSFYWQVAITLCFGSCNCCKLRRWYFMTLLSLFKAHGCN